MKKKRVLLGMSGGTDSSVSAMLLQEQGYEVVGITFRFWSETDDLNNAQEPEYIVSARDLSVKLNIEHHILDLRKQFYNEVVQFVIQGYMSGITPNPCTKCNPELKWKMLDEMSEKLQCQYIATGHYVNTLSLNGINFIRMGKDPDKEQSFFLWGLSEKIRNKALFPLGEMLKSEVKEYARKRGFVNIAIKKESIGICFLHDGNYQRFLQHTIPVDQMPGEGNFVDSKGRFLGKHKGFPFYTVGQRRGLGLNPKVPLYVAAINYKKNEVVLDHIAGLYQNGIIIENVYIADKMVFSKPVITRIRYRKQSVMSMVEPLENNCAKISFMEPEWACAPGQAAAFYDGFRLLGGGIISVKPY